MVDDSDARVASGFLWQDLTRHVERLGGLVFANDTPEAPEHRAVGPRYLTRFLFGDATPKPVLRRVKLRELRSALPPDTPHIGGEERAAVLSRRNRALQRRYGY
jgi:hypothetical protein